MQAPASPSAPSSCAWALPTEALQQKTQKIDRYKDRAVAAVRPYGGPAQYLRHVLCDDKEKMVFAEWLHDEFPEDPQQAYEHSTLPIVTTEEMASTPASCVHVSALGFGESSSLKMYPAFDLFQELVCLYMAEGFLTAPEPMVSVFFCLQKVA